MRPRGLMKSEIKTSLPGAPLLFGDRKAILFLPGFFFVLLAPFVTAGVPETRDSGFVLVDDFQAYDPVRVQEFLCHDGWIPHRGTGMNRIAREGDNHFLAIGFHQGRTVSRRLPPELVVEDESVATLFLRVRIQSETVNDARFGLANDPVFRDDMDPRSFGVALRITGRDGVFRLQVFDSLPRGWTSLANMERGKWYNLWLAVERSEYNRFAVYKTEGTEGARRKDRLEYETETEGETVSLFPLSASLPTGASLNYFMASADVSPQESLHFDQIWLDNTRVNLSFPVSE